jgi:hypothetical protein
VSHRLVVSLVYHYNVHEEEGDARWEKIEELVRPGRSGKAVRENEERATTITIFFAKPRSSSSTISVASTPKQAHVFAGDTRADEGGGKMGSEGGGDGRDKGSTKLVEQERAWASSPKRRQRHDDRCLVPWREERQLEG